ncbi:HD-GYP domain-containing protein [Candidatus Solirubrobacter pratensis]|uniref:HD-GYP domain-containing protein n=1 Tax=Candidatus Solirubrobacter pratensis TaxID=1298857 RepID=UPI000414FC50|nr:HD domain-containing phosphohydrolase [Candidatus Solirubrobacter pratensis]
MQSLTTSARRRFSLALHGSAVVALIPAFLWIAPPSRWDRPELLLALLALAVIARFHDVPLSAGIHFDAGMALALIALAVAGPLPALLVDLFPMVVGAVVLREPLVRAGNLANVAAYGWKAIAAALVLSLGAVDGLAATAAPWLLLAAATQMLVNVAVGPAIYIPLWLGRPFAAFLEMFAATVPAAAVMMSLGTLTAVLTGWIGVLALAVFALIAVLPQSALTYAARTKPAGRLEPLVATQRYAYALALHLGLDRHERRHLARVANVAFLRRAEAGDPIAYACATLRDPSRASWEAGHVNEWWNGAGGPAGLRGAVTPLTSRIVAVADTWSALTARGGPQLSHAEALEELENASGARFDPQIVLAAHSVVAEERVSETEPAPEPRLHTLRLPAQLRRALASV